MADLLQAGSVLEGYEIQGVVRRDGFSVDYEAAHPALEGAVIVKELLPEGLVGRQGNGRVGAKTSAQQADFDALLARFLAQYQVLERIDHASIINVRECWSANGTGYAVLDFPQGETLEQRLQEGEPLPASELTALLSALINGLGQVHRANLLHRDIVPEHVVISPGGRPVLVGFGAGPRAPGGPRQAFSPASAGLSANLTAGYAPLEQYSNRGQEGPWTDIYALGALAYRCATGIVPEDAPSRAIHDDLVPAVRAAKGGHDPRLLAGIDAALAMRVADRPQSLAAWRSLLSRPREDGSQMGARGRMAARRGPGTVREASKSGQKGPNWLMPAAAATLFIAVLTGVDVGILRSADEVPTGPEAPGAQGAAPLPVAAPPAAQSSAAPDEPAMPARPDRHELADADAPVASEARPSDEPSVPDERAAKPVEVLEVFVQAVPPTDSAPAQPMPEPQPQVAATASESTAPEPTAPEPASSGADERTGSSSVAQSPASAVPKDDPQRPPADAIPVAASVAQEDVANAADSDGPLAPAPPALIAPAPQPFTVTSAPAGAAISFVDGSGPYVPGMMLVPGNYRILAELQGYSLWEGTLAHGQGALNHDVVLVALPTEFSDPLASGGAGPVMVRISPGSFRMGCVSGRRCFSNELPVLEVNVEQSYAISKHEVTVSEYDRFIEAAGYGPAETGSGREPAEHPVTNVDWHDAEAYTQWLSAETGRHYRLPTESEWEFAARAGSAAAFTWGDDPARGEGNCSGCGRSGNARGIMPVGSFTANPWGLHDMHGNVWEWVLDCPGLSRRAMQPGVVHQARVDCRRRVRRGGSWAHSARRARSASRDVTTAALRSPNTGFRVLLVNP